jgi:hypothetical protein
MSDQIVESLKEWFEKEWLYERHLTNEFMKDKESFQKGCETYDSKNYAFKGELNVLLRKESGLAEVARVNKNLEKYATHCFRQVEKVFSELIQVNPGRQKLGEYFLYGYDMIQNPSTIKELNPSIIHMLNHRKEDGSINERCLVLKLNYILKNGNYFYQAPEPNSNNPQLKYLNHEKWNLSQKESENIFKGSLWFDTFSQGYSKIAKSVKDKPTFEAYSHMAFFRNIGSHLNSEYRPLQMPKTTDPLQIKRIKGFYNNPVQVMDNQIESPGFYQRYVDMVLFLYSEFLKNPHF